MYDRKYMVKQFVATIWRPSGSGFRVLRTGDDRYYLFCSIDPGGCETGLQFPVEKRRLRDDLRRALSHGVGLDQRPLPLAHYRVVV